MDPVKMWVSLGVDGCGAEAGRQREGDRETDPERETMTLEVTYSYPELPQSEGRIMKGFPAFYSPRTTLWPPHLF